jgi:hypothetical protein
MKTNIYHVTWSNGLGWDDHDERSDTISAKTPEEARQKMASDLSEPIYEITAELKFENVEIPE